MKRNYFFALIVIFIIVGLSYNMLQAYKQIDYTQHLDEELNHIKLLNKDLQLVTSDLNNLNYDKIKSLFAEINSLLFNHRKYDMKISEYEMLKNDFKIKADAFENLKSIIAILNNSYRNNIKLSRMLHKTVQNEDDKNILDELSHTIMLSLYTKRLFSIEEFNRVEKLFNEKYSDSLKFKLLLSNMKIYRKYFNKFNVLEKELASLAFDKDIDTLINESKKLNQNAQNRIMLTIVFFIILLISFMFYLLFLQAKLNEKVKNIKKLNMDFNKYIITSTTDLKGKILTVSEKLCEISGYEKEELIGQSHSILKDPNFSKEIYTELWDAISKDKVWKGVLRNRKKDGSFYWVDSIIKPMYDIRGKKIGYTSIRQDITFKKEVEELNKTLEQRIIKEVEKNRQKEQKLVEQSRLAQMGEMISMIAHQWRQPLGAISSTAFDLKLLLDFSEEELEIADELNNGLDTIADVVQTMSSTIDDFRNFYKPNKLTSKVRLDEPVTKALKIIQASLSSKNIQLTKKYESKKNLEIFDNEILQVVLNIIKNAQDNFIEKEIKNGQIIIKTFDEETKSIIEICDNGGGIPEDILEKIFDPYFSTKDEKNGTGLGLYMSKTIVETHHGGKFYAQNRDNGVCFTIELNTVKKEKQ